MNWTIAFDSGCDLRDLSPRGGAELTLVPLSIMLGHRAVVDDGSTSSEVLQAMLDGVKVKTGTACPSVGDWYAAMEGRDNVIAVTISGAVSGSWQSACAARDMILEEEPERNIFVMDSVSGSGGMEALVNRAAELIGEGASFETVCRELEACRSRSEIFFLLQNVDNLVSNGRLNPIVGRAVKALKLCLLATVSPEGTLEVISKVRGFEKAMDRSIEACSSRGFIPKKVIISHCLNESGAQVMKKKLLKQFPWAHIELRKTGLLCGYYAEKGGLIVALED